MPVSRYTYSASMYPPVQVVVDQPTGRPFAAVNVEEQLLLSLYLRLLSASCSAAVSARSPRSTAASRAGRTGANRAVANESYNLGNRVLAELLGGMIGGALIGWVLDRLFGTSPVLLLTLLFLGIGVAFRNIFRLSKRPK